MELNDSFPSQDTHLRVFLLLQWKVDKYQCDLCQRVGEEEIIEKFFTSLGHHSICFCSKPWPRTFRGASQASTPLSLLSLQPHHHHYITWNTHQSPHTVKPLGTVDWWQMHAPGWFCTDLALLWSLLFLFSVKSNNLTKPCQSWSILQSAGPI